MKFHILKLTIILIVTIILLISCTFDFENIGAPVWTVEATVPFSERVYKLDELITDSSKFIDQGWGIFANEQDSILRFEYFESIEFQEIGDRLTYSASEFQQGRYTNTIGTIHIVDPPLENNQIAIDQVSDDLSPDNPPWPIPEFRFNEVEEILEFEIFNWVQVEQGTMTLTIHNNYPFSIDSLQLRVQNAQSGELIDEVFFPDPIPSMTQAQADINLNGKLLRNEILINSKGKTPGTVNPVAITGEENMLVVIDISEMDVQAANAQIGDQEPFARDDGIVVENDNQIQEAVIKSGTVFYQLENTLPLPADITLEFPNIKDEAGNIFTAEIRLPASGSTEILEIPLENRTVSMDLLAQRLEVKTIVNVEGTGTNYATISNEQGVEVVYWSGNMVLHSLSGVLYNEQFELPSEITSVEIPSGLENIDFRRVSLIVDLKNQINIPLSLNLDVVGINQDTTITLHIVREILPGDTIITIDRIDRIIEMIPEQIGMSGEIEIGVVPFPEFADSIMSISSTDGFEGSVLVRTNLRIAYDSTSLLTDPVEITDALDVGLQKLSMNVNIANTIPLSGMVKLLMGNSLDRMETVLSAIVPRGDIVNHRAQLAETTFTIGLDQRTLAILERAPIYTQQEMTLFGTDGDTVHLRMDDSIKVQISATAFRTINPNEE